MDMDDEIFNFDWEVKVKSASKAKRRRIVIASDSENSEDEYKPEKDVSDESDSAHSDVSEDDDSSKPKSESQNINQDSQISNKHAEFFETMDSDDDDYAFALSLQTQYDNERKEISTSHSKGAEFLQQIDEDLDYAFALSIQTQYDNEEKEIYIPDSKKSFAKGSLSSKPLSIIDEEWELIDPHPDIHALFQEYDGKFFYGKLKGVEVKWSPRMTLCAGVCSYEGRGGLCSIRLSVPLLKLRPRKDLVETLLHEMIHAYLFVTCNNKDRSAHGPEFLSHMNRINKESGTKITVYHSFHGEVDLYRQHWWKCNGPCKDKRPFYGLLKRAMNRAPGPKDRWWTEHQANCGGTFIKIKEPDNLKKKSIKRKADPESKESQSDIRNLFKGNSLQNSSSSSSKKSSTSHINSTFVKGSNISTLNDKSTSPKKLFVPFQGSGHKLADSSVILNRVPSHILKDNHNRATATHSSSGKVFDVTPSSNIYKVSKSSNFHGNSHKDQANRSRITSNDTKKLVQSPMEKFLSSKVATNDRNPGMKKSLVNQFSDQTSSDLKVLCPVCLDLVKEQEINSHLDTCLSN